jgi:DnaJ-class molecular chaperone
MAERDQATGTVNPGDEAPAGTVGTGEAICPDCHGSGRQDERRCPTCNGTGVVTEGIGGG